MGVVWLPQVEWMADGRVSVVAHEAGSAQADADVDES